jgi:hypothetical protein
VPGWCTVVEAVIGGSPDGSVVDQQLQLIKRTQAAFCTKHIIMTRVIEYCEHNSHLPVQAQSEDQCCTLMVMHVIAVA